MATNTDKLGLEKPGTGDQYSIDVFNSNADKIDNFAKAIATDTSIINDSINGINTNVNSIKTNIGNPTDAAGTTTVFARLKQIYDYLVNTVYSYLTTNMSSSRMSKIDTIDTKVGTNTDTSETTTLFARLRQIYEYLTNTVYSYITTNMNAARMAKIDTIDTSVNTIKNSPIIANASMVKSIQSGVAVGSNGDISINVNIATVVPSKCVVTLDGWFGSGTGLRLPIKTSLTATVLTVGNSFIAFSGTTATSSIFSWQVIENY